MTSRLIDTTATPKEAPYKVPYSNRHLNELMEYVFRLHVSVPGGTLTKWRELIETGEDVRKIRLYIYWYSRKINGMQNPEAVNALFGKIDHFWTLSVVA